MPPRSQEIFRPSSAVSSGPSPPDGALADRGEAAASRLGRREPDQQLRKADAAGDALDQRDTAPAAGAGAAARPSRRRPGSRPRRRRAGPARTRHPRSAHAAPADLSACRPGSHPGHAPLRAVRQGRSPPRSRAGSQRCAPHRSRSRTARPACTPSGTRPRSCRPPAQARARAAPAGRRRTRPRSPPRRRRHHASRPDRAPCARRWPSRRGCR